MSASKRAAVRGGMSNQLDPLNPSTDEQKKIPRYLKVYGILCMADGIIMLPLIVMLIAVVALVVVRSPEHLSIASDPTLTIVVTVINVLLSLVASVLLIRFGYSLLKKPPAQRSHMVGSPHCHHDCADGYPP